LTLSRQQEIDDLFRHFGAGIGNFVLARVGDPELAEEITARAFLQVVRHIEQLRGPPMPWLWSIVRTELAKHFRGLAHHRPLDEGHIDDRPSLVEDLENREFAGRLQEVLAALPDDDQQIIAMKFFLRQTNREISAALQLTPSNVGVRVFRILRQMRGMMATSPAAPN
jgi:RNA polymerase sigma-70 factor (ECF subfamily)